MMWIVVSLIQAFSQKFRQEGISSGTSPFWKGGQCNPCNCHLDSIPGHRDVLGLKSLVKHPRFHMSEPGKKSWPDSSGKFLNQVMWNWNNQTSIARCFYANVQLSRPRRKIQINLAAIAVAVKWVRLILECVFHSNVFEYYGILTWDGELLILHGAISLTYHNKISPPRFDIRGMVKQPMKQHVTLLRLWTWSPLNITWAVDCQTWFLPPLPRSVVYNLCI